MYIFTHMYVRVQEIPSENNSSTCIVHIILYALFIECLFIVSMYSIVRMITYISDGIEKD
jgi:hypothetical protein